MFFSGLVSLSNDGLGLRVWRRGAMAIAFFALAFLAPLGIHAQTYGVFMKVADPVEGSVAEVSARVEEAVVKAGWNLLAAYDVGVDAEQCSYEARVVVVDWPEFTRVVMSQGNHGAYAAPLRISVFEDELGVHVAAVNPLSMNRTIVAEEGMEEEWTRLARTFRATIRREAGLSPAGGEYGQFREKGRIGRTMGVMAGGPFVEKFKLIQTVEAGEGGAQAVAQSVFDALSGMEPGGDWGMRPAYVMSAGPGVAVLGLTGDRMEAKSFSIVGKGSDKNRGDFACPGLDHAAAYPIEVVFTEEGGSVNIHMVDAMFRMKMFFEDAGKMSFARNMGMPGSIADEMKSLIESALF